MRVVSVASAWAVALAFGVMSSGPAAAGCYDDDDCDRGRVVYSGPAYSEPVRVYETRPAAYETYTKRTEYNRYEPVHYDRPRYRPSYRSYYRERYRPYHRPYDYSYDRPSAKRYYSSEPHYHSSGYHVSKPTYSYPAATYSSYDSVPVYYTKPTYSYSSPYYHHRPYYRPYHRSYYDRPVRYSGGAFLQTGSGYGHGYGCGKRTVYIPYGWRWYKSHDYKC